MNQDEKPAKTQKDLSDHRLDYTQGELSKAEAPADPLVLFDRWFHEALDQQVIEPYAMTLATSSPEGRPSARTVLMRGYSSEGITFYTNYLSHKGADLAANPQAEVLFFWAEQERQVRIFGSVSRIDHADSAAYFAKRPKKSQLAALVSTPQSGSVASRDLMEARYAELEDQYAQTDPECPEWWGGYRIELEQIEFWQGRDSRMHDRLVYTRGSDGYALERLLP